MTPNRMCIPIVSSPPDRERWSLCAVGDVCALKGNSQVGPARPIERRFDQDLKALIRSAEISIVNLEAPTCRADRPIPKSGPSLRMDESVPVGLKQIGFDVATLANNHTMDFGPDGLAETLARCRQAGLLTCGAGASRAAAMQPTLVQPAGGIRVRVLAFCEREFGIASDGVAGTAWLSDAEALDAVAHAQAESDVVIVAVHGGVEVAPLPPPQRCRQLRRIVDAGATLVIGHHPHVPHGWERYRNGVILYSLGNCLFDYPDGEKLPKTDWGIAVTATFDGATLTDVEITLTAQRTGTVGVLRCVRNHWDYLKRLSELTTDPDLLEAYWQELAVRLLADRYWPYLLHAVRGSNDETGIRADGRRLLQSIGHCLRPIKRTAKLGELPRATDPLLLLNLVRNESHRWTIATALELMGGDVADRRTPQIQSEIRELMKWTME